VRRKGKDTMPFSLSLEFQHPPVLLIPITGKEKKEKEGEKGGCHFV
jgi:hypothetical protein